MTTGLFPETLNAVLKAFDVYRRSYITEEGKLTGIENISKSKYEASFLMFLILVHKIFYFPEKTALVDVSFGDNFFFDF